MGRFRGLWWALFLGYAGLIFSLSDGPLPEGLPLPSLPGVDKLYHFVEYGVLAWLGLQAVRPHSRRAYWAVLLVCWLYGATDELHQSGVLGREADWGDWLADGLGIFSAGGRWWAWQRRRAPARVVTPSRR